jgi:hypothetical protein
MLKEIPVLPSSDEGLNVQRYQMSHLLKKDLQYNFQTGVK